MSKQGNPFYDVVNAIMRRVLRISPSAPATQARALAWGYRYRPRPTRMRLASGLSMAFDTVDHIPLMLYYTGTFEPALIAMLNRIAAPGDTVLDVGANIGFVTLEAWRATGHAGRVLSIEASPAHAETVRRNLALNGLPTEHVLNVAVGDADGQVTLSLPPGGNGGMYGLNAGGGDGFTVACRRIDDLLADRIHGRLTLIKMDIEGSEAAALRGATAIIARHRPAILIELNDEALRRCGASAVGMRTMLGDLGYDGWVVGEGAPRRIGDGDAHACDECLFLPREDAALRGRLGLD